jgi:hypothetical protein
MIRTFGGMRARAVSNALLYGGIVALLLGREVSISLALRDEFVGGRSVLRSVSRLKHNVFVVIQTQPFETFYDRTRGLVRGTL